MENRPYKLVICSWAQGIGAGAARMESYYYRYLDRSKFDLRYVSLTSDEQDGRTYDSSMRVEYLERRNRFSTLLRIFADADIVQFQGGFDPLVCEAARISGVPVLVEVLHNIESGGLFNNIDITVCVSEAVRREQPSKKRTTTILNGIDLQEFPYKRFEKSEEKIVLLQVSNREKVLYNIDELANELLGIDPRIELWLAGRQQNLPSTDRIKYFGVHENIAALYQQADLLVMPSRAEPFGLVAVEAMASGCLPILSDAGAFPEIVSNELNGWLVNMEDRGELVEGVKHALKVRQGDTWTRMQDSARHTTEQFFSAPVCVRNYERIYLNLVGKKGRRRAFGPTTAFASPEAFIGDAVFHSHNKAWDLVDDSMKLAASHPASITNVPCAEVAYMFAKSAYGRENRELAYQIYRKLYESGYRQPQFIDEWLEIAPNDAEFHFLENDILERADQDAVPLLRLVEHYVHQGELDRSRRVLEQAQQRAQQSEEVRSVYQKWYERISPK